MTMLQRLVPVSALAVGFLLLGCENVPTADTASDIGDEVLLAKGGGGKPGGGGPAEITILFDRRESGSSRSRGYSILGMDRTGAHIPLLGDADEIDMESVEPRWAPDGLHFVYNREVAGEGYFEIVIGHVDGTVTPILAGPSLGYPVWSPQPLVDGQARIAYVQEGDLYVMGTGGSDVHQLTYGLDVENLAWSRDATQILAAVRNAPDISSHLELFDVTCDASACEVTGSTALDLSAFGIAPDDRLGVDDWAHLSDRVLIHYVQAGSYGLRELGILDLADSGSPSFTFLTDNPGGQAYNSAWSWDDSEVVYVKFPIGKKRSTGIVIRDVATGEDTQIYDGGASSGMDWRPTAPSGG
jgi:hypothetical protein